MKRGRPKKEVVDWQSVADELRDKATLLEHQLATLQGIVDGLRKELKEELK